MFSTRFYVLEILLIVSLFLAFAGGCSSSNEEANKLYMLAIKELEEAVVDEENFDCLKSLEHYKNAKKHFDGIVKKYPSSERAIEITKNKKFNVRGISISPTSILVRIESVKLCAEVEKSLFATALYIARKIVDFARKANALIEIASAMVKIGDKAKAKEVIAECLEVAEKIGSKGDKSLALSEIASLLVKIGDIAQARTIFTRALNTVQEVEEASDKSSILSTITKAIEEAGKNNDEAKEGFSKVLEAAKEVAKFFGDSSKIVAKVSETAKIAEIGEVVDKAKEMLNKALEEAEKMVETKEKYFALDGIATAMAEAGDITKALEIAEKIYDNEQKHIAFEDIANRIAKAGDIAKAVEVAEKIGDINRKVWAFRFIVNGATATILAKACDVVKAKEILTEVLKVAERIGDASEKDWAFRDIAIATVEVGDITKSLEVAEKINDTSSEKYEALREIATSIAKTGDITKAKEILNRAIEKAEEINDDYGKYYALQEIATGMAEVGDVNKAKELFTKALEVAEKMNDYYVFQEIATGMAKAGDVNKAKEVLTKALKMAERTNDDSEKYSAFREIAIGMAKVGEITKAFEVAEKMNGNEKFDVFGEIVSEIMQGNNATKAKEAVTKVLEVVEKMDDISEKFYALGAIAFRVVNGASDVTKAKEIFNKAFEVTEKIGGDTNSKLRALADIAAGMAKAGDITRALEIAEKIDKEVDSSKDKFDALRLIARAIAETGNISEALRIADKISNAGAKIKSRFFINIANALLMRAREIARAKDSSDKVYEHSEKISDRQKESNMSGITRTRTAAKASETTEEVDMAEWQWWVCSAMVSKLIEVGRLKEAIEVCPQLSRDNRRVLLVRIAIAGAMAKLPPEAEHSLIKELLKANPPTSLSKSN